MLHTTLIVLHTVAATVCFVAAILSLRLTTPGSWRFRTYLVTLVALVAFMVGSIAVDWPELDTTTRLVYLGLSALGLFMITRGLRAGAGLRRRTNGWRPRYIDDVGFTLISLFAGFVIVSAIDLHWPGWLVGLIAVGGIAGAILVMKRIRARLVGQSESRR